MKKENTSLSLPKKQVDLVMDLYSSDKIDEAIDMIKALNEDYPNVPLLFNLLGACYNKLRQFDPAAQFFETAISIKPDYAEAFLNHGIVMREVGKLDHAAKNFKKATEINPSYTLAHLNLGITLSNLGQKDEAIKCFEGVLSLDPDNSLANEKLKELNSD